MGASSTAEKGEERKARVLLVCLPCLRAVLFCNARAVPLQLMQSGWAEGQGTLIPEALQPWAGLEPRNMPSSMSQGMIAARVGNTAAACILLHSSH